MRRIAAIYNEGIRERIATFETRERTLDDVIGWIHNSRYPFLVAEARGEVVGWIGASRYRDRECYDGIAEFSVYVTKAARGRGIGDVLMGKFLPRLVDAGFWKGVVAHLPGECGLSRSLRPPWFPGSGEI